jgi:hypothetical protein
MLFATSGHAQTSFPMVMSISPVAVQAGTTTQCAVNARYSLDGACQIIVSGEGVSGEVLSAASEKKRLGRRVNESLKLRFKAAAHAAPGVRDVRLVTPRGCSTLGQLVVVRDAVIRERRENDTRETAQLINLPAAVCGSFEKAEDVDFYKFPVEAGSALTFHVWAQRLENKIHDLQEHADPILTLYAENGSVLAVNDNFFFGDPLLHYGFARAGTYYLEVRDARYGGNPYWEYCIEINDRPFVTNVYPSRVTPGVPTQVHLIGYNLPAHPIATITLPSGTPDGPYRLPLLLADQRESNPVPIIVSRLPDLMEAAGDHSTLARAQPIVVPVGISGCIARPGEADFYSFHARKGEHLTFRIAAREHQSALDSFVRIRDAKGTLLTENDDAHDRFVHADSLIENWTVPAEGQYVVEVHDLHWRGGPAYVYFLEVTRSEPYFTLDLDTDKTILSPGLHGAIFVRAERHNGFAGAIELAVEDLPAGISASCGRILASGRDGCIILHAAADAKMLAGNIRVLGRSSVNGPDGKPRNMVALARPLQEIYMPGGGRFHYPVLMHTVSVAAPLDLRGVKINPASVTLRPGESKRIEVEITRAPGFSRSVSLSTDAQHLGTVFGNSLPAGISVDLRASQTLLTGENTKGWITLRAAPNAQAAENQLVPIMAHVSINFVVKMSYCGEPLLVSVKK